MTVLACVVSRASNPQRRELPVRSATILSDETYLYAIAALAGPASGITRVLEAGLRHQARSPPR